MNFTNFATLAAIFVVSVQAASVPGTVNASFSAPVAAVTASAPLTTSQKIQKIMNMKLNKFGDLKEELVKDFLTPEEWGRIDYHDNDAPLNSSILEQVMTTPSNSLTVSQKIERILALNLGKVGDLKEDAVRDILTAEEWGKVDYYDNDAALTKETLEKILN